MNIQSARHELTLLDRALVRLLERRTRLLLAAELSHAELERRHADLAQRSTVAHERGALEALFARLDAAAGGRS
jgi:hypothetical protein